MTPAEKSQFKALSIGPHGEISLLLLSDVSTEKTSEQLTSVCLKLCFLGFVHRHR